MKFLRITGFLALTAFILLMELGCGDQYRPVANPIVSGGGQPTSTHYAYVVNYNANGPGSTTQIDVSGDTNVAVNSLGLGSVAEAFPPNSDALFVANSGNDTVSEYLPILAGAITTIALLPGSHPVFVSSAQNSSMYVINSGTNSTCPNTGSISTIPTTTLSVTSTVCVGVNPTSMVQVPTSGVIYVLNQGDGSLSVYTPGSGGVSNTITAANGLGANPVSLTASTDGNWVFVVSQGSAGSPGALDIISAGAASVGASVPLGVGPTFSVIDPVLNRLYVTNTGDNTVSVFDATNVNLSNSPAMPTLATVNLGTGTGPIGVTALADGTKFYVANGGSDNVTVVSASSYSVLSTVALAAGANPVWIASDPTASRVYVANQGTTNTTIIQTSNNAITLSIPAPPQISGCVASCALQQPVMIITQ
ncbi:MAG: YncE family protein [Candidatus Korobacteraceae bacterium]